MEVKLSPLEEKLYEPVKYYINIKGKNIRKHICNVLGKYFGIENKIINDVSNIIDVIHNASLVIDDIQDNSTLRRNNVCAHIQYGVALSLNSAYLTLFRVFVEMNNNEAIPEKLRHKIVENIYYTHIGQGMDIYYTKEKIIPSLEDYNTMIEYKTGMLFITMLDMLMENNKNVILNKNYEKLKKCVTNFALFFQIRDDYINLTDEAYWRERGFCQDFDEEKISYLITYCNEYKLKNYDIINELMTKKNKTHAEKVEILLLMNANGLLDIIYDKLVELKDSILEILNFYDIPDIPDIHNIHGISDIFNKLPFHRFNEKSVL